ncbi:3-hydroxy-3-methylglutaryl Coenzyme A reductase [Methanolacinia petrolearia DSM 11571]|uniref:3-hydroxy-3-methylglutaryl coenzyme A reductase n=1 Tax=Methanolacinia petrolearia (strain DSM 11571 / OCM 486 / SEBR 4847) TaxID=679926 RepID=E1RHL1_METP4|nr:hydroxymethylglutaryl-CoA reductase (NADPH) [Methanolacinia petrolearia]ADN35320.1 3-hydroxy-3-methylglutaryl Coenzyme A reductase [Methanolacinia petrolearia DSM 11571]
MNDYLSGLKEGRLKLHSLEKEMPPKDAVAVRRAFIEMETGKKLDKIGDFTINIDRAAEKNCENMIGAVQVPVGIAGKLKVNGEYADDEFYIPLATTEGALVASINRGCKAITLAGGADVRIQRDGMTRAPVFAAKNVVQATEAARWIEENITLLKEIAETTTSHGKLLDIRCFVTGTNLHARIEFFTGDAMGMNMVTIASEKVAAKIQEETGVVLVALSGNMCTDKKPSAINVILGRGKTVVAGVFLPDDLIKSTFKTDSKTMAEVNMKKNLVGSARAVSLGFNSHAANVIAAVFLACGQDPAHVVEGSNTITTVEQAEGGVYVSVTLPSLQVGTVGGGTGLDTQREALNLLGCAGGGETSGANSRKFAEIIAAAVLAGELSLIGALGAGHLARAHKQLGR